jgi:hypothetical protein
MRFVRSEAIAVTGALLVAHLSHGFVLPTKANTITDFIDHEDDSYSQAINSTFSLVPWQSSAPAWLRTMPLGASITAGQGSSPMDGYRKPLRDHLRSLGYKVNIVGSQYVQELLVCFDALVTDFALDPTAT